MWEIDQTTDAIFQILTSTYARTAIELKNERVNILFFRLLLDELGVGPERLANDSNNQPNPNIQTFNEDEIFQLYFGLYLSFQILRNTVSVYRCSKAQLTTRQLDVLHLKHSQASRWQHHTARCGKG
jgi:hypothetical protein